MSEENSAGSKKSFQVVDRRRFDSDGRERQHGDEVVADRSVNGATGSDRPTPQAAGRAEVRSASGPSAEQAEALHVDRTLAQQFQMESGEVDESGVSFTSFLMSLATQALVQIGEMDPPEGMEIPLDIEAGRQTIEILSMLQRKTRGNLSSEEGRFLEEVLHTLRMSYVRKAR
jgi:hypothetical protein